MHEHQFCTGAVPTKYTAPNQRFLDFKICRGHIGVIPNHGESTEKKMGDDMNIRECIYIYIHIYRGYVGVM